MTGLPESAAANPREAPKKPWNHAPQRPTEKTSFFQDTIIPIYSNLQQYNFSLHLYIFRSIRCHKIPACRLSPARLPSKMSRTSQVMTDQNMYIFFGSLQLDTETTTLWYRNKHIQKHHWLVVSTSLKNISQLGWLFPTCGKIKNVPNHPNQIIFVDFLDLTHVARKTDMLQLGRTNAFWGWFAKKNDHSSVVRTWGHYTSFRLRYIPYYPHYIHHISSNIPLCATIISIIFHEYPTIPQLYPIIIPW